MSELEELGTFLEPILAIPYKGKQYKFEPVDAETGAGLMRLVAGGVSVAQTGEASPEFIELVSDADEKGFYETVLGSTHAELVADGVSFHALKHIGNTVLFWHIKDFDAASEYFLAGGKAPKAKAKAPQDRKPPTATRTSTAAARTTKKPASASITNTPKATGSRASHGSKS